MSEPRMTDEEFDVLMDRFFSHEVGMFPIEAECRRAREAEAVLRKGFANALSDMSAAHRALDKAETVLRKDRDELFDKMEDFVKAQRSVRHSRAFVESRRGR